MKSHIKKWLGPANIQLLKDYLGSSESPEIFQKRVRFYNQIIGKYDTYFDVGANFGNRVAVMLHIGCRVIAVDPQSECCKYLRKKYGQRITVIEKGAGAEIGQKEFFISDATTISTFATDWIQAVKQSGRFGGHDWQKKVMVQLTTLDALIQEVGLPRFIKIDVEGYELEVLQGLTQMVDYLSFEYTVPEQTNKLLMCIRHIRDIGQGKVLFNYSQGESMEWALPNWLSAEEAILLIESQEFLKTNFGDIYARKA